MTDIILFCYMLVWYSNMFVNHIRYAIGTDFRKLTYYTGKILVSIRLRVRNPRLPRKHVLMVLHETVTVHIW